MWPAQLRRLGSPGRAAVEGHGAPSGWRTRAPGGAAPHNPPSGRERADTRYLDPDDRAAIEEAAELVEETRVDDRVIASLSAERVRAAVASLPDEQRVVLSLAYWSGLSQTEIAARTDTPLGTVKGRAQRALQQLRTLLQDE